MPNVQDNPGLHRLYVIWAMEHLVALEEFLKLSERSNFNWLQTRKVLYVERAKLVEENEAYKEAVWRHYIGQTVRERADETGESYIWDERTQSEVPLILPAIPKTAVEALKASGEPGFINSEKAEKTNAPVVSTKTHANKLTYEQRRQNGLKGAAIRRDKRRAEQARLERKVFIWEDDNNGAHSTARVATMGAALRYLNNHKNRHTSGFTVYDIRGKKWLYHSESGMLEA